MIYHFLVRSHRLQNCFWMVKSHSGPWPIKHQYVQFLPLSGHSHRGAWTVPPYVRSVNAPLHQFPDPVPGSSHIRPPTGYPPVFSVHSAPPGSPVFPPSWTRSVHYPWQFLPQWTRFWNHWNGYVHLKNPSCAQEHQYHWQYSVRSLQPGHAGFFHASPLSVWADSQKQRTFPHHPYPDPDFLL